MPDVAMQHVATTCPPLQFQVFFSFQGPVAVGSNYSERTRELGPEGSQLAGASSYSNVCGQSPLAKLDLIWLQTQCYD